MAIELITGKSGKAHVDSCDDGAYHARTAGPGTYVLHGCECTMSSANTAHIAPGELLVEGRHVRVLGTGEDVTIENGTQGQKRSDLVCVRYEMGQGDIEAATLTVVKGGPVSDGTPADPKTAGGSILAGDATVEHPLYRIPLDGVSVGEPVRVCEGWEPLAEAIDRLDHIYPLPVEKGGSGADAPRSACGNLGALTAASPALVRNLSFASLSALQPGTYLVANDAVGNDTGQYGNLLVARSSPDGYAGRLVAIVSYDNGAVRVAQGYDGAFSWRSVDNWLGSMNGVLDVGHGGTGATDADGACENLGVVKGYRGELRDMSWESLYGLAPGAYIVMQSAYLSPDPGFYGQLFVSLNAGDRITAFAVFDNGNCYVAYGAGAVAWARVDQFWINDAIVDHGYSGSFEYWKYRSGFARLRWVYGASTAFNAYGSGYLYSSGRFAFPFPLYGGLKGAVGSNNKGTNVLNAYPVDITSDSFAFYIGALSPTSSPWQVCFEFEGTWK